MKNLILILITCMSAYSTTLNAQSTLKKQNAVLLENRFSNEVVGLHNADLLNTLLSDDFISHHFPTPGNNNKQVFIEGMRGLFAGFPDIKVTRKDQHQSDDKVYTYAFWEGTHSGIFMGISPTNKKVHVEYMDIWKVKDGKITENWVVMDIMGMMIQLGVVPAQGSK